MRRLFPILAIAAIVAATSVAAQSSQKPETKEPPPSPAGKWNLTTTVNGNEMANLLTVKLDGKKVTGTLAGQAGEIPLEGEFADGKLSFSISVPSNGNTIQVSFNGAFKTDGTLAGSLDYGQGPVAWTATRVKEK
jgi:hypothetical protein